MNTRLLIRRIFLPTAGKQKHAQALLSRLVHCDGRNRSIASAGLGSNPVSRREAITLIRRHLRMISIHPVLTVDRSEAVSRPTDKPRRRLHAIEMCLIALGLFKGFVFCSHPILEVWLCA